MTANEVQTPTYLPYGGYAESEVEWIERLPVHWSTRRLKTVLAEPITDGPHESPEFVMEGVPFLSVDGIQDGELRFEGCRFVSLEEHLRFRRKCAPRRDDILFGKAASTGKIARVKTDQEFSVWSPLALIRGNNNSIESAFLEYALKAPETQFQIDLLCNSNTQKNIGMSDIPLLAIPLPPLPEQRAIAAFLDRQTVKIDELIAKKERLIALLQEQRAAVITHAVTRGIEPAAPMKDSGVEWLGEVPAHWVMKKLGYIADLVSGGTPSKERPDYWRGDVPWVSPKDMKRERINDAEDHISAVAVAETGLRLLPVETVLIVVRGMILGHSFPVAVTTARVTINQDMKGLLTRGRIDPSYFALLLIGLKNVVLSYIEEAAHGTRKLRTEVWKAIPVAVPPRAEQLKLVSRLERDTQTTTALIDSVKAASDRLREYRSALISAAVTGKIDVRGEAE